MKCCIWWFGDDVDTGVDTAVGTAYALVDDGGAAADACFS